jgi:hypothetical protein
MFARHVAAALGGVTLSARTAFCDEAKEHESASKSFFDADALERGAKAVREIDRSTNAKAVRSCAPFRPSRSCTFQLEHG